MCAIKVALVLFVCRLICFLLIAFALFRSWVIDAVFLLLMCALLLWVLVELVVGI